MIDQQPHRTTYARIALILIGLALGGLMGGCGSVEKADYTVLAEDDRFEIRRYEPYIVAETTVDAGFDEAGDIAFDRLYGYISGDNRTTDEIAMTAPVNQQARSEEIAMTTPVNQQASGDRYVVSFIMPSKYTMETLPQPNNPAVTLRRVPARTVAALRYSGSWSQQRYEDHLAKLRSLLAEKDFDPIGDPVFARYDPPFKPSFLRRNEVLIPVEGE